MTYEKIVVPEGEKITFEDGQLQVPDNPIVAFIEGDGIGVDITPASMLVWDAAVEKAYGGQRKIAWMEIYSGEKAAELYDGNYMPEETFEAMREYLVGIKGSADNANRRRLPQPERDPAPGARPVCLRAPGTLYSRHTQPDARARENGYRHFPRKHGRCLFRR